MTIYPAIDIKGGKCVRLKQGRTEHLTVYNEDPVEVAQQWKAKGARFLHVVDLDGAFQGYSGNESIIKEIIKRTNMPVQVGGGIRSMERIVHIMEEVGAARVILGTAAIEDPTLVERAVSRFGTSIAVGIDARNNRVATRGWLEECDVTPIELGKRMKELGVEIIIYTDILRDGMLEGPNIPSTENMIKETGLNVIASGGVSSLEHVAQLKSIGVAGVIIGKALYSGEIDLGQALKLEGR